MRISVQLSARRVRAGVKCARTLRARAVKAAGDTACAGFSVRTVAGGGWRHLHASMSLPTKGGGYLHREVDQESEEGRRGAREKSRREGRGARGRAGGRRLLGRAAGAQALAAASAGGCGSGRQRSWR